MNKKHFLVLVILTVVLGGYLVLSSQPAPEDKLHMAETQKHFAPALSNSLSSVAQIKFYTEAEQALLTFSKQGDIWTVVEKNNYPADTTKINQWLVNLADSKVLEYKTKKPEYHHKLGVADFSQKSGHGVKAELLDMSGQPVLSIFLGGQTELGSPATFARLTDENQVMSVSGALNIDLDNTQWLQREIIHVEDEQVKQVVVKPAEGLPFTIFKHSPEDEHFTIKDLPSGTKLVSEHAHDGLATGLQRVNLNDVLANNEIDLANAVKTQVDYQLFDGTQITVELNELNDIFYASFNAEMLQSEQTSQGGSESEAMSELDVDALNQRFAGRIFKLPNYKGASMNKVLADFVELPAAPLAHGQQPLEEAAITSQPSADKEGSS